VISVDNEPYRTAQVVDRAALQATMWNFVGIERSGHGLKEAALRLALMRPGGDSVYELETTNLLELANAIVRAALYRKESRGAHFRLDFPETLAAFRHPSVCVATARKVAAACL
jgi:L-aspartate oxidase